MNRQDGTPLALLDPSPPPEADGGGPARGPSDVRDRPPKAPTSAAKIDNVEDVDDELGDADSTAAAAQDLDDDLDVDDFDDGPTLTLTDPDDEPALENAFVGDVADDAALAATTDEPIEFDEGESYPRLAGCDGDDEREDESRAAHEAPPTLRLANDDLDETADDELSDPSTTTDSGIQIHESPADPVAEPCADDPVDHGSVEMPARASNSQAIDGSVALDDLAAGRPTEYEQAVDDGGGDDDLSGTGSGTPLPVLRVPAPSTTHVEHGQRSTAAHPAEPHADQPYAQSDLAPTGEMEAAPTGPLSPPDAAAVGEVGRPAGESSDDLPASYQAHFLEDGEEEDEFVAHVESPDPSDMASAARSPTRRPSRRAIESNKPIGPMAEVADGLAGEPVDARQDVAVASVAAVAEPALEPLSATDQATHEAATGESFDDASPASPPGGDAAAVSFPEDPGPPVGRRGGGRKPKAARADRRAAVAGGRPVADEGAVAAPDDLPADYAAVDDDDEVVAAAADVDDDAPDPHADDAPALSHSGRRAASDDRDSEDRDADDDFDDDDLLAVAETGGAWTIPLLCLGLAVIACCLIIPQADANRRLAYERQALRRDLDSVQAQVATNDEFLRKLAGDPALAERLAQRQMKLMRPNTRLLPVGQGDAGTSPFDLVQVTPPAAADPYEPIGGRVAAACYVPRTRLYLMGGGLFVVAAGLVLGAGGRRGRGGVTE